MNDACTAEPISHLRLERYLLEELPAAERAQVDGHLLACTACRACLAGLRDSEVELRPLPLSSRGARRARLVRRAVPLASALAAAAAVLLGLRALLDGGPPVSAPPPPVTRMKGGELAIDLVRERDADIARDPARFRAGDRFQVLVTCPPGAPLHWDLVVFQGDRAFFPLPARALLECGNHVALPGAFRLDGRQPARVCIALDARTRVDRARLASGGVGALPATSACRTVVPD